MIPINDKEEKRAILAPILITFFAAVFIIGLVAIFYLIITDSVPEQIKDYFGIKTVQVQEEKKPVVVKKEPPKSQEPPAYTTKIIKYVFPSDLPTDIKSGYCLASSIAQPFRQDAFRCQVSSSIYDPCFSSETKDKVICQMNPLTGNIFLINVTKQLPVAVLPKDIQDNWAWFLELEDGTICSPYTGTRPVINNEMAVYGCKPQIKGDLDVLIGDLIKGEAWTAKRVIATKDSAGTGWNTKSSEVVKVKTIWQ